MARTKINLIELMNIAWDKKQKTADDEFAEKVKNLVSHSYVDYDKLYEEYCKKNNKEDEARIFITFQHVFVFMMLCDGDLLQNEYDAYCKYCSWAGYEALSTEDCHNLYKRLTPDQLIEDIGLLVSYRDMIDPENYRALVQGFCYFSLCGDNSLDENEYYILRCFFEKDIDYSPATWEQFKKEWV